MTSCTYISNADKIRPASKQTNLLKSSTWRMFESVLAFGIQATAFLLVRLDMTDSIVLPAQSLRVALFAAAKPENQTQEMIEKLAASNDAFADENKTLRVQVQSLNQEVSLLVTKLVEREADFRRLEARIDHTTESELDDRFRLNCGREVKVQEGPGDEVSYPCALPRNHDGQCERAIALFGVR